jgi:hypothetical protein
MVHDRKERIVFESKNYNVMYITTEIAGYTITRKFFLADAAI